MMLFSLTHRAVRGAAMAAIGLGLAACQPGARVPADDVANNGSDVTANAEDDADTAPADNAALVDNRTEPKSIIRPEIEPAPSPTPAAEPVETTIPFPARGTKPDASALALIDTAMADPVYRLGGPITLWGHSDSAGSDAANLAASRRRAEAVRDYLVGRGAAPDRITVIAMGESSPVMPNRKLDGSDDPQARDRNRRVVMKIDLPPAAPAEAPPSR